MAHDESSGHDHSHSSDKQDLKAAAGTEQNEPGQASRHIETDQHATTSAAQDIEEIASQQGASQRGYTADGNEDGKGRPAQFDPEHPGGRPEGDPRR